MQGSHLGLCGWVCTCFACVCVPLSIVLSMVLLSTGAKGAAPGTDFLLLPFKIRVLNKWCFWEYAWEPLWEASPGPEWATGFYRCSCPVNVVSAALFYIMATTLPGSIPVTWWPGRVQRGFLSLRIKNEESDHQLSSSWRPESGCLYTSFNASKCEQSFLLIFQESLTFVHLSFSCPLNVIDLYSISECKPNVYVWLDFDHIGP